MNHVNAVQRLPLFKLLFQIQLNLMACTSVKPTSTSWKDSWTKCKVQSNPFSILSTLTEEEDLHFLHPVHHFKPQRSSKPIRIHSKWWEPRSTQFLQGLSITNKNKTTQEKLRWVEMDDEEEENWVKIE